MRRLSPSALLFFDSASHDMNIRRYRLEGEDNASYTNYENDSGSNPPRILFPLLFLPDRFFPLLHLRLKLAPLSILFDSPPLRLSLPASTSVPTPMLSTFVLLDHGRQATHSDYVVGGTHCPRTVSIDMMFV